MSPPLQRFVRRARESDFSGYSKILPAALPERERYAWLGAPRTPPAPPALPTEQMPPARVVQLMSAGGEGCAGGCCRREGARQGKLGEAEPLYCEALDGGRQRWATRTPQRC